MTYRGLFALVTAALALGACGGNPAADPSPSGSPAASSSTAASTPPTVSDDVVTIDVPAGPVGLAPAGDGVWVVSPYDESVSLLRDGAVVDTVGVAGTPLRAEAVEGDLWVTAFGAEDLVRVAAGKTRALAHLRPGPEGLVHGWDRLWVVEQDGGTLAQVDPASGRVERRTRIGVGARLVASGPDGVYVSHTRTGRVLRIDPDSGEVVGRARTPRWPQGLAVADGRLWVACTFGQKVVSLDARTLERLTSTPVDGAPDAVTVTDDGRVLVATQLGPTLVELDPDDGRVLTEVALGTESDLRDQGNIDVAVHDGSVYVSSFRADAVHVLPLSSL